MKVCVGPVNCLSTLCSIPKDLKLGLERCIETTEVWGEDVSVDKEKEEAPAQDPSSLLSGSEKALWI